jgi:hypothetical protein
MSIEQSIDEMQIARTAGAGADGEVTGDGRLARGRKRRRFLVTNMDPLDRAASSGDERKNRNDSNERDMQF